MKPTADQQADSYIFGKLSAAETLAAFANHTDSELAVMYWRDYGKEEEVDVANLARAFSRIRRNLSDEAAS